MSIRELCVICHVTEQSWCQISKKNQTNKPKKKKTKQSPPLHRTRSPFRISASVSTTKARQAVGSTCLKCRWRSSGSDGISKARGAGGLARGKDVKAKQAVDASRQAKLRPSTPPFSSGGDAQHVKPKVSQRLAFTPVHLLTSPLTFSAKSQSKFLAQLPHQTLRASFFLYGRPSGERIRVFLSADEGIETLEGLAKSILIPVTTG